MTRVMSGGVAELPAVLPAASHQSLEESGEQACTGVGQGVFVHRVAGLVDRLRRVDHGHATAALEIASRRVRSPMRPSRTPRHRSSMVNVIDDQTSNPASGVLDLLQEIRRQPGRPPGRLHRDVADFVGSGRQPIDQRAPASLRLAWPDSRGHQVEPCSLPSTAGSCGRSVHLSCSVPARRPPGESDRGCVAGTRNKAMRSCEHPSGRSVLIIRGLAALEFLPPTIPATVWSAGPWHHSILTL